MQAHHQGIQTANKPIRDRLNVVERLLSTNRAQLERPLDLYQAGDFSKEILAARKAQLEVTVTALE